MYAEVTAVDPDKLATPALENKAATYAMASYTESHCLSRALSTMMLVSRAMRSILRGAGQALRKHMAGVGMLLQTLLFPIRRRAISWSCWIG